MDYPTIFPLRHTLERKSPETVRAIVGTNGFRRHPDATETELWYKLAGPGYAVVRIDDGHLAIQKDDEPKHAIGGIYAGFHSRSGHYHKEWIAAELFARYVREYVHQVVRYDDLGQPITRQMNDWVAKRTHIKQ